MSLSGWTQQLRLSVTIHKCYPSRKNKRLGVGEFTRRSNSETGHLPRAPPPHSWQQLPTPALAFLNSANWLRRCGPERRGGRPLPEKLLAGYQPEFACFRSRVLAFLPSFHPLHCPPHPAPCWPTQGWRAQVCSPGFAPTFTQLQPSGPLRNQRRPDVTAAWWRSGGSDSLLLEGNTWACAAEGRLPRVAYKGPGLGPWPGPLPWWVTEVKGPRVHPKLTSAPFCLHLPLAAWVWERQRGRVWSLEQPGTS